MTYIKKLNQINKEEMQQKSFSLASSDYKIFDSSNKNTKLLKSLIAGFQKGREIGSESYISEGTCRFIKTNNISSNFLLDESSRFEKCIPQNQIFPKKGDILIVKDGGGDGLGESCLYNRDNSNKTDLISSGIIRIFFEDKDVDLKYYILGFLKSKHFKNFIDINTPQGSTIRHSNLIALEYPIPFLEQNESAAISELSLLVQDYLDKEEQIVKKNKEINEFIDRELETNSVNNKSEFSFPSIKDILQKNNRLDSTTYVKKGQKIPLLMNNYKYGTKTLSELGFNSKRGQNLQISNIGESLYSEIKYPNFFQLTTSSDIDDNRVIKNFRFIANKNINNKIKKGDILFSATGQVETSIGKTYVFCEIDQEIVCNINSFIIYKNGKLDLNENIFVSLILSWLKYRQFYKNLVGKGNGGSLTTSHFSQILIPNFNQQDKEYLSTLYYNDCKKLSPDSNIEKIKQRNSQLGIYQLNKEMGILKNAIDDKVKEIAQSNKR